jgi:histidine triad (HIT) family protein
MTDCLFCKIIAKQIPSDIVYEDENVFAFLDINPVNPGHALVVPKKHSQDLLDADPQSLQSLIVGTQKVAQAITKALGISGFNFMQNNGAVAGQVVKHLHFHIIPRNPTDGLELWHGKKLAEGESALLAKKIRDNF